MFVASFVGHSWPPMSEIVFPDLTQHWTWGTSGFWISGYLWASLTFFSTFLQTCFELNFMLKIKDFIENRLQHMGFLKNFAKILGASILSNVDRRCFFSQLNFRLLHPYYPIPCTDLFWYPLKTSENLFMEHQKRPVAWNVFNSLVSVLFLEIILRNVWYCITAF